ncbi:MAG: hypothetical protein H0W40_14945 [Methylibium sp.]|uniref:hypothetical protein n=1 Tax=Methylibium sp. TaxID=2067992 RepID=UPI00181E3AB4|nr:hypothetical protein [Methylibium sp.]MBA3598654.1 hypothetical protein [Methylibium sp.]
MSSPTPSPNRSGNEPPLNTLREPDGSGLALWSALFVASSALLVFFTTGPAYARPNMQTISASAPRYGDVARLPSGSRVPVAVQEDVDRDAWQ